MTIRRVRPAGVAALCLCGLAAGCAPPAVAPIAPPPSNAPPPPTTVIIPPDQPEPPKEAAVERCPKPADIRRVLAARPTPLRSQAMPSTPAERVAKTTAQLGMYEADGAWADRVESALRPCLQR